MNARESVDTNRAAAGGQASAGGPSTAAIVIGVATLAVVAVVAFLVLQPDRSSPVGEASATPSALVTPTASPLATPEETATPEPTATPAAVWEMGRVFERGDDPATDANVFGVTWYDGPGWIAYGLAQNTEGGPPAIWTSQDGLSWTPGELPSGLAGAVVDVIRAEVDGTTRYVAALRTAILISDDGLTWEQATTPDSPAVLSAVAHGPAGFVAIGVVTDEEAHDHSGRIWRSADGAQWEELGPPELATAWLLTLEVVSGRYVAAGFPDGSGPPMVAWSSGDAETWEANEIVPPGAGTCICAASTAAEGLVVALGTTDNAFDALSEDGTSWSVEPLPADETAHPTGGDALDDGAIVVTASVNIGDGPKDALIWVRDAGSSEWRAVDWRAELPDADETGLGRSVYVAIGEDRTAIVLADGTVFLSAERLP